MSTGVLTAGSGQGWENDLVASLAQPAAPLVVVRRCVDIAEVLAVASTGQAGAAVLSGDLRRLDSEAVQRLASSGIAVVGVHPAADHRARTRLGRLGITALVPDDAGAVALVAAVRAAVAEVAGAPVPAPPGAAADTRVALPSAVPPTGVEPSAPPASERPPRGTVVAVWGPTGAPGRTTIAAGLAAECAASGRTTLLVDADVYGGVLASAFGILDESPGLAGASRVAANGRLDAGELVRLVWGVGERLGLLTGISRADRWPELRPSAIPKVLGVAREIAEVVVVDCAFALEADEEITFDTVAPRRNGATLAVLADADLVLAVGSADPPGMERLIRGLAELGEAAPDKTPLVVLNRLRRSASSRDEAAAAVARFAGLGVAAMVPEDREVLDKAWRAGQPLRAVAPSSPLAVSLRELAGRIISAPAPVQKVPAAV